MDAQVTSPLVQLPVELLLYSTRYLSTTDLCSMRITCRAVERALFKSFSFEFFRRKQFMFSDFSLQALLDISRHPNFSQTLQHVSLGLDRFNVNFYGFKTQENAVWFHQEAAKQVTLLSTGRGLDMLTEAFTNLKNLTTVDIRDFNSPTRFRDGSQSTWASYGATTITTRAAGPSRVYFGSSVQSEFASSIFSLVLGALAKADARPENLEVLLRRRSEGLFDHCFDLTSPHTGSIRQLLAGLRKLHVDVDFHRGIRHALSVVPAGDQTFQSVLLRGICFHKFLARMDNMDWLRINFQHAKLYPADIFMSHFAVPETPSSPRPLCKLSRLDFGHTSVSLTALISVVKRIPTLRKLTLRRIALFDAAHVYGTSTICANFLRQLANVSNLHNLALEDISEGTNSDTAHQVLFGGKSSTRYLTGDITDYINAIADLATVDRPMEVDEDGDDLDTEDFSDDDQEEL